ncbi:hypothetical protein [Streptomyces sp. NBC_01373]|uniref:hypothetical protein n=1 Tax=unclassified Streptomyces TaxID=2593676 RepID=UPI0022569A46|nr:hypothetical protein [Streptomyces sp. NBC_01373]MCX4703238.1 hypothetical protein [Streptomyces sp. NBC_01373]
MTEGAAHVHPWGRPLCFDSDEAVVDAATAVDIVLVDDAIGSLEKPYITRMLTHF